MMHTTVIRTLSFGAWSMPAAMLAVHATLSTTSRQPMGAAEARVSARSQWSHSSDGEKCYGLARLPEGDLDVCIFRMASRGERSCSAKLATLRLGSECVMGT